MFQFRRTKATSLPSNSIYPNGGSISPKNRSGIHDLKFNEVQLLKDDLCGTGSYGRVCRAMVDQLVCAAKLIHPTFFSEVSPSSTKTFQQFQQECDFLSAIRHPCIVQYLGTTQDTESGLLVLLMELVDESLTKYLERKLSRTELVPYHKQVNFSHDICMALSFLHSNGIVHRDLSSNNILLVAESKVKVTDFGMSRLVEQNPRMTPLTQCPGCLVYMAPEALRTPPTYSEKLDVFSLGVCIIQIITCKFPKPGNAKRTVEDPHHGTIEVPIPERERRKDDISSIQEDNLLLSTALVCLADSESNRPTSEELCHQMVFYKSDKKYSDSVEGVSEREEFLNGLEAVVAEKDQELELLRTELDVKGAELSSLEEHHSSIVEKKDYEIERLKAELEQLQLELTEQLIHQRRNNLTGLSSSPRQCGSPGLSLSTASLSTLEGNFERVNVDGKDFQSIAQMEEQLGIEAPHSSQWYHGPLGRVAACQRLQAVNLPGSYLIRESCSEKGAMVLSFLDGERHIHHFRITRNSLKQFNIGGNIWFSSLTKLVGFHSKYSSVVERHAERLDNPVAPPTPVQLPPAILMLESS